MTGKQKEIGALDFYNLLSFRELMFVLFSHRNRCSNKISCCSQMWERDKFPAALGGGVGRGPRWGAGPMPLTATHRGFLLLGAGPEVADS